MHKICHIILKIIILFSEEFRTSRLSHHKCIHLDLQLEKYLNFFIRNHYSLSLDSYIQNRTRETIKNDVYLLWRMVDFQNIEISSSPVFKQHKRTQAPAFFDCSGRYFIQICELYLDIIFDWIFITWILLRNLLIFSIVWNAN
jgi:hypothetical protein